MGMYRCDPAMTAKSAETGKMIGGYLSMAHGEDDSVPMHMSKNKDFVDEFN